GLQKEPIRCLTRRAVVGETRAHDARHERAPRSLGLHAAHPAGIEHPGAAEHVGEVLGAERGRQRRRRHGAPSVSPRGFVSGGRIRYALGPWTTYPSRPIPSWTSPAPVPARRPCASSPRWAPTSSRSRRAPTSRVTRRGTGSTSRTCTATSAR